MMARRLFDSIKKQGEYFYGRYRKNGKDYYTPTVKTKRETQLLLDQVHADIIRGQWNPNNRFTAEYELGERTYTIETAVDRFLESLRQREVSPNTLSAYTLPSTNICYYSMDR